MNDAIAISQALLTPVIAVATTYIAYQQYRIRRDERSLTLYDRRLSLYKLTIGVVDRIRAGNVMMCEEALTWLTSIAEVEFLFGDEVHTVTDGLFGAVYGFAVETEPIANGGTKDFDVSCMDAAYNVERFRKPLQEVFAPYLRPVGSPIRQKKRLTLTAAAKLVADIKAKSPNDDVPF